MTIIANNKIIYDTIPAKGRVNTKLLSPSAGDTLFKISVAGGDNFIFKCLKQSTIKPGTYIYITLGDTILHPVTQAYNYVTFFKINGNLFQVTFPETSSIDWDLYLVNDSTGDTCYWRSPAPDWGVIGYSGDDPYYNDVSWYPYGYPEKYANDKITTNSLCDGSYSIYVKYYDGGSNQTGYNPVVNIVMGV